MDVWDFIDMLLGFLVDEIVVFEMLKKKRYNEKLEKICKEKYKDEVVVYV